MTVDVTVSFNYEDQRWTHAFDVDPGTTIMKLKEKMIAPKGGTKKDADFFELRLRGQRVSDAEEIHQAVTLDFEYLGAEEGAKRAREDEVDRKRLEKDKENAMAKAKQKPKPVPKRDEPAPQPKAPAASPLTGDVVITVIVDAELDFKSEVKISGGGTIADLKVMLAEQDPTGGTKPESFGLAKAGSSMNKALPDSTVLTDAHLTLQVADPYVAPPPSKPAATQAEVIPGVIIWKVTGGADKGGILVRKGQETTSAQLGERLATGAVVEQVQLVGERLHYKTISGAGPAEGWVSLSISGKELLKKLAPGTLESFPLSRAIALQQELLVVFGLPAFQEKLNALIDEFPEKKGKFLIRRNELIFDYQRDVIAKYGFEGSQKGVSQMLAAFAPHMQSPIVQANSAEIDAYLQI